MCEATVIVTDHADKRIQERLGLPRKARYKAAERAFTSGKKHGDYSGRMKKYLDSEFFKHKTATQMRVHAQHLWLFRENVLITVLDLPTNLKRSA